MSAPEREALDVPREHLAAAVRELAGAPADRDPLLWAAHEIAECARALVDVRAASGEPGAPDLDAALALARSAMLSLTYARRSVS